VRDPESGTAASPPAWKIPALQQTTPVRSFMLRVGVQDLPFLRRSFVFDMWEHPREQSSGLKSNR